MQHLLSLAWAAPVPTAPTSLEIEVAGPMCELVLRRSFRNDEDVPVDTELWYGLPVGGTLDRFVVTVGDRTVSSRVVRREEADAIYVAAANEGRVASKVDQQEPDVAVQHIANVLPGEMVTVELHLIAPVQRRAGVWELAVPLTVAPRLQDPGGEGPVYAAAGALADPVEVHLQVRSGKALRWLESPSHAHRTRATELWTVGARADRDLIVRWSTAVPEASSELLVADGHGVLLVEPPAPWARQAPPPADVVLLVDASDTMAGPRWQTVLQAVEILLSALEEHDTLTLLVFADTVRGLAIREPATIEARAAALVRLEQTPLGGMTNLPLALRAALALPSPPGRARTLVLLSDGGAPADLPAQDLEHTTLHTVGIGAVTGRALLQQLAQRGGGLSVTMDPADPEASLAPLLQGLQGPVLTDATVTFPGQVPAPLPPMYADQLVTLPARGLSCEEPARLQGTLSGRPYEQLVEPTCTDQSRLMAVMWAVDQIRQLPAHAGTEIALEYQVLSPYTSLVGTDTELHNPLTWAVSSTIPMSPSTDHTSIGYTFHQIAVKAGGQTLLWTVQPDGASVAQVMDAVTGTFSLNFNFDALREKEELLAHPPEAPGSGGPVVRVETDSGTNNLESGVSLSHGAGALAPQLDEVGARLSGPLLRDKIWLWGSYGYGRSALSSRLYEGHGGLLKLTAQPNPEHRLTLSGLGESGQLAPTLRRSGMATARWQLFAAPDLSADTRLALTRLQVDDETRESEKAQVDLAALSVDDPWGGSHDLKAGLAFDRAGWADSGRWTELWLGQPVPAGELVRLSWFLQDRHQIRQLFLLYGARVEHTLGQTFVGPRLYATWYPGDERTVLHAGYARVYGHLGLPSLQAPSELDEGQILLKRELVDELWLGAEGELQLRSGVPVYGGGSARASALSGRLFLEKEPGARWGGILSWRHTRPIELPELPLLDEGLHAFAHELDGQVWWDLPTDPWTTSLGLTGAYSRDPLGTVLVDPLAGLLPNLPRASAGLVLRQDVSVRKGTFTLQGKLEYLSLLPDDRDLSRWTPSDVPLLEPLLVPGGRVSAELRYGF